jgi:sulfotransferase
MNHELVMLSGLPRSGSTVLTSLLNQHPKLHATTTSPVLGMLLNFSNNWEGQVIHQIEDRDEKQKINMVRGMLKGAHEHFNKPIVIDKNRGWPKNIKLVTELLGKKPKMICTVRDIPSIFASFVTLANKQPGETFIDKQLIESGFVVNNINRCRLLWQNGVVGESWQAFKYGYQNDPSSMLLLTYDEIVMNPKETMLKIEKYLEIEAFDYDINNLKPMNEKDEFHGIKGLHDIRPALKKTSLPPEKIIGGELTQYYNDMKLNFWH